MAKYNITEKRDKDAAYRSLVNPMLMDELKEKILDIILFQKKYKDKDFSAKKLAAELNTNTRYMEDISTMVGFANRQSFYASFFKINGITPREYRLQHMIALPPEKVKVPKKRGRKPKNKTQSKSNDAA